MSREALRWLSWSLVIGAQMVAGNVACLIAQEDSETLELKLLPDDSDPEEGVPGGSVRLLLPDEADDSAAPPATPAERAAADAEQPTAETLGAAEPSGAAAEGASESEPPPALSPQLQTLRDKVRRTLAIYQPKYLNTRDNSPWEVMHGIIAYGVDAKLHRGSARGEEVNAISWMCYNGGCRGEQLLSLHNGTLVARQGPGLQGHFGQFLAIIAQSHVKRDYPISVGGKMFSIEDLIDHEKLGCQAGEELTFKLIGLMHYMNSDATWLSRDGQSWSISRLVREELSQPIRGAACGGTHRLMGLSYAVNKRIQRGEPVVGEFSRAQRFINDYHRYTFSLQNADGSFSTEWFKGVGASPDIDRRLKTSGHTAEWLSFSLNDQELTDPRMIKAIDYLSGILGDEPYRAWEIGPLGHGLHALRIYDRRVFKPHDSIDVAARPSRAIESNPDETSR